MHELALTEEIVRIACQEAGSSRIKTIVLEIGELSGVMPDAVEMAFQVCRLDTAAEQANLEIRPVKGWARCRECGSEQEIHHPICQCVCGSCSFEWLGGTQLKLIQLELLPCVPPADAQMQITE